MGRPRGIEGLDDLDLILNIEDRIDLAMDEELDLDLEDDGDLDWSNDF